MVVAANPPSNMNLAELWPTGSCGAASRRTLALRASAIGLLDEFLKRGFELLLRRCCVAASSLPI